MTACPKPVRERKPVRLRLPYPPSANRYWRVFRGRAVKSTEARAYQSEVGWMMRGAGMDVMDGAVSVTIRLYRPRAVGDLDNRLKVVLDALQGYGYTNDSQVVELHAYRYEDKKNPRVEIELNQCTFAESALAKEGRI